MRRGTTMYRRGPNGYALYFGKGGWRESASVQNSQLDTVEEELNEQKLPVQQKQLKED